LEYFGEMDAPACRVCDFCLAKKKAQQPAPAIPALRTQLIELLQKAPQTPRALLTQFAPQQAETVTQLLRELVDAQVLRYEANGQLRA
jgi:ATP-dependent DNA helicase RecQ